MENAKQTQQAVILGNAARLSPEKGQEYLLEVACKLREMKLDFKMLIAGSGAEEQRLKVLSRKYGLQDCLNFLGHVEDMDGFMHSLDIFLFPSKWEGFGFAAVEAMIHEKPVVAFKVSCLPEIVIDGKTGFLAEPFDLDDFAQKVRWLAEDEKLRKHFGKQGRERALHHFNQKEQMEKVRAFIFDKIRERKTLLKA